MKLSKAQAKKVEAQAEAYRQQMREGRLDLETIDKLDSVGFDWKGAKGSLGRVIMKNAGGKRLLALRQNSW